MSHAIMGLGKIETAIAQAIARAAIEVAIASQRPQVRGRTWTQLIFPDLFKREQRPMCDRVKNNEQIIQQIADAFSRMTARDVKYVQVSWISSKRIWVGN